MNIVIQLPQSMVHYAAQFQIIIMRDHAISRQVGHVQLVYYVWLHCFYVMINDLPRLFNYPHRRFMC